jgi:NADP-dependent 3-hydroxy acid dehydrogenase YdfG
MMAKALAENGARKIYIIGRREDRLKEAASFYPK